VSLALALALALQPVPTDSPPAPSDSSTAPVPSDSHATPAPSDSPAAPVPPDSPATPAPSDSTAAPVPPDSPAARRRARRTRFSESAPFDLVSSGARRRGAWAAAVQLGYPWFGLRAQLGLLPRLAILADLETALAQRWRPAIGIGLRWVDRPHFRLGGELLLGWLFQGEPLDRRGPNAEARIRLAVPVGRVAPYLTLGTQHTILPDRTRIIRESGTTTDWSARHEWTLKASLGLVVAITQRVGLDLGIDLAWVGAPNSVGIPGLHLGVLFGGGPRGAQ